MVRKLPRYLIDRWSREVDRWLDKDEDQYQSKEKRDAPDVEAGYPPFSVFCHFLQRESRIACNPVTSVRPQKEEVRKGGQMASIRQNPKESVWDSILKYTIPQAKFSECGCVIASTCHVYSNFAI